MGVNVAAVIVGEAEAVGGTAVGGGGGAPHNEGWHAASDKIVTRYTPKFLIL
jgi:hypothetical protein